MLDTKQETFFTRLARRTFLLSIGCWFFSCLSFAQTPYFVEFSTQDGLSDKQVTCFFRDMQGYLWVGTENGLNRFDGYACKSFLPNPRQVNSLSSSYIFDIKGDKYGNIWVATRNGLNIYDPEYESFHVLTYEKDSIPNSWVNALFVDGNGEVWMGCDGRNLAVYSPTTCRIQTFPWKAYVDKVLPQFREKAYRNIEAIEWLSDSLLGLQTNLGFFSFHTQSHTFQYLSPNNPPKSPYKDPEGYIWKATDKGFAKFNPSLQQFHYESPLPAHQAEVVFKDWEGSIWTGSSKKGLSIQRKGDAQPHTFDITHDGFLSQAIMDIAGSPKKNCMWIATEDYGLHYYNLKEKKFTLFQHSAHDPTSLSADICYQLAIDKNEDIWVATDPGGIAKFKDASASFERITTENGLPSNVVNGINIDNHGNIWAATLKGIIKWDPIRRKMRQFTEQEGLPIAKIEGKLRKNPDGSFTVIPPSYGYTPSKLSAVGLRFHPDSLRENTHVPNVFFTQFSIFDKPLKTTKNINFLSEITLQYTENFFSFEMLGLEMNIPTHNQYAYQLVGYDENWNYCGTRRYAAYTNVPPGDYVLQIKAANHDGWWNEHGRELRIHIIPPFWKTRPFYLLSISLMLALLYLIYRARRRQIEAKMRTEHEKSALKADFSKKIAEAEMSALRAQMNPHFIFNALTSINRFIIKNEPEAASDYLVQFSNLVRRILDNARSEKISLADEIETLRLYVEIEQLRFFDNFHFHLNIQEDIEIEHIEIPSMLIQPYIENAIWHGLMQKENGSRILDVTFFQEENNLHVHISDNGIGRKSAQALKSKTADTRKSHGMRVTSDRMELVRQLYGMKSEVTIVDLAEGTRVEIILGL